MGRVSGKVALVTGAARGQGEAEAALLAHEGAHVCLTDVLSDEGQAVAKRLQTIGHDVLFESLDVRQEGQWDHVVRHIVERWGRLDILVNNAGIFSHEGVLDSSLALWHDILEVNQTGVFLGIKTVAPVMMQQRSGSIINISSIYGLVGSGSAAAYQATKGAIRLLTKTAAIELAPFSVRVNSVHPGVIDTEMLRRTKAEGRLAAVNRLTALPRLGTAQDVAYGVLYLASEEAAFVTGSELIIDGGYTAR
ncbi:MAG: cyclopentanol dehydrogenase [Sulfobacillus acidophilus]|uniref:Cyclopentanol dehydrogenase n=1 Tax=Sulfobacillus acidophilus TaxID=53633 RepID=A0A2T2WNB4_9FIRM|nr:MAG: cyclopentanol dehydrogenase [Sulfobacillus acidophilus]